MRKMYLKATSDLDSALKKKMYVELRTLPFLYRIGKFVICHVINSLILPHRIM